MTSPTESGPDREIAVPLGLLCRGALVRRPEDPQQALLEMFVERYGDEGDLFYEFCLAQYDLTADPEAWQAVAAANTIAVIAIHDLPESAPAAGTFVVTDEADLSQVPAELQPLVEHAIRRRQTGDLSFEPVPPPTRPRRSKARLAWPLVLLALAAGAWFLLKYAQPSATP